MSDTTTLNIGLLVADPNDVVNYTNHIGNNWSVVDGLMGAVDCTSTARPTNTYKGQIVFEHDTGRYAQNTGTKASPVWTYVSHQALSCTSSARPSSGVTAGMLAYETDTQLVRIRGTSSWLGELLSCTVSTLPADPLAGDVVYLSDKECLARYTGSQWHTTGVVICTSSTHPTSSGITLYAGMSLYETDTNLSAVYNGSNWFYPAQQIAATQVITTNTASVTFSGIPSAYTTVSVLWTARENSGNTNDALALRFNGDTTNSYGWQFIEGNSTTSTAAANAIGAVSFIQIGICAGGAATAGYFSSGRFDVVGWNKSTSGRSATAVGTGYIAANTGAGGQITGTYGGQYIPGAQLSSITLLPNNGSFVSGSEFTLLASM